MPLRQQALFRVGCWLSIVTAVVHLTGALAGRPAPADVNEAQLFAVAGEYRLALPGAERSLFELFDGFSLAFAVLLATQGAVGLAVAKRGRRDGALLVAVARAMALAGVALLVISLTHWFLVPSLFIATMTSAFAFASVRPPAHELPDAGAPPSE